jgi:DNA-binding CsgD family transcriptional regulator
MRHCDITLTERLTLHLLCRGHRPQEIARLRTVEVSTVRSQLRRLYEKTDTRGMLELVIWSRG